MKLYQQHFVIFGRNLLKVPGNVCPDTKILSLEPDQIELEIASRICL